MSNDRDRDLPPGLYPSPPAKVVPAQYDHFHVASMALHSPSKGWLPAVELEMTTADGAGIVGVLQLDTVADFVDTLLTAAERARDDFAAAKRKGVIQ